MATLIVSPAQSMGGAATSSPSSGKTAENSLTNEDTFLKLLVSQIQHQDPLSPTDGVQFLGQLTSFSQLEQLIQINQTLKQNTANASGTTAIAPANTTAAV